MELKLYDTLTREKRVFRPLDASRVRMYVCGPTVYDFAHIGNARPVIVFDVLFRLLRHLYGAEHVTYVRNITDVDDKINARAAEEYPNLPLNEAIRLVTEKTERQFHEDVDALGCLRPTVEPRATEHIAEMKTLIERLVAAGHAYVAEDHVLFSVPSMPDYGRLSKLSRDEIIEGARVEVAPFKHDPMDFVLWKPSKPGEPAWPSPLGVKTPGRPGWHIECSAMSWKHLGETFDIHGGGIDLVFPHHENEIAQSRCAFHTPVMANYWMHNGFLQVEGEKMSKSLGNFVIIRDLLERYPGDILRLTMLKSHYRQPNDWTLKAMEDSRRELTDWANCILKNEAVTKFLDEPHAVPAQLLEILSDDLNTPDVVAFLHHLARRSKADRETAADLAAALKFLGFKHLHKPGFYMSFLTGYVPPELLETAYLPVLHMKAATANSLPGLISQSQNELSNAGLSAVFDDLGFLRVVVTDDEKADSLTAQIERLVAARDAARKARDFTEADRIRRQLAEMNVEIEDTSQGPRWKIILRAEPATLTIQGQAANLQVVDTRKINELVQARRVALRRGNFKEADRIRDELHAMGIELEDKKDGTTAWKVKS